MASVERSDKETSGTEKGDTAESVAGTGQLPSLADRLKCATKSVLCGKIKVQTLNPAAVKKRHLPGTINPTDPETVSAESRIKEFPNESLIVRNEKLFCSACREEIALKKSTITNHISTGEKHKRAKETLEKRQAREQDIAKVYDQEVHPKGSASVSMDSRVLRVRVVEIFLMSGIPISKIDCLRSLLEEGSCRLTHSSHLSEFIPIIYAEEKKRIKSEIEGHDISVIFDGSTRLGEALGIVVRFVSEGCIKERLVKIAMLARSLSGEELVRELLTALSNLELVEIIFLELCMTVRL